MGSRFIRWGGEYHRNNIKKMKCGLEILEEFGGDYGIQGRR